MYEVIFYYDNKGCSELVDYLDTLQLKAKSSKSDKICRNKILTYIGALEKYGTRMGMPYVKHIRNAIWELRPLNIRIFFFYWKGNKFVILSYFVKKKRKTPKEEIERAERLLSDFLERNGE